jgi:hypothetical protein
MPKSTHGNQQAKRARRSRDSPSQVSAVSAFAWLVDALIDEPKLTSAGGHKKGDGPKMMVRTARRSAPAKRVQGRAQVVKKFTLVNRAPSRAANRSTSATASTGSTPLEIAPTSTAPAPVQALTQMSGNAGVVVGAPMGLNTPGLRPIARVEIMSETAPVTIYNPVQVLSSAVVADPTGTATDALPVNDWANRFQGFQQYRIRSTKWILTPIRPVVGTATATQAPGAIGYWIQDTPQAGPPTANDFLQANRRLMCINTDREAVITYSTNEPQDLNLSDIDQPPSHITGSTIQQGQHALLIYGDAPNTNLVGFPTSGYSNVVLVTAIYDIEFFGVGGV